MNDLSYFEQKRYYINFPSLKWIVVCTLIFSIYLIWIVPLVNPKYTPDYYYYTFWAAFLCINLWRIYKYPIITILPDVLVWNYNGSTPTVFGAQYIQFGEIKKIWIGIKAFRVRRLLHMKYEFETINIERHDGKSGPIILINQFKPNEREEIKELVARIQERIEILEKENL